MPNHQELIKRTGEKAASLYREGQFLCSEAVLYVTNELTGSKLPPEIVKLASGLPVGIGSSGCVCGALSGGVLALGLTFGRTNPGADNSAMFIAAKKLHDLFKKEFGSTCCRVLIRDFQFGSPEHLEHCVSVTRFTTEKVAELTLAAR